MSKKVAQSVKKPKMVKFLVGVKEVWERTLAVKLPANATKEQIFDAAFDLLDEGDGATEYSHTLKPDQWTVHDDKGNLIVKPLKKN